MPISNNGSGAAPSGFNLLPIGQATSASPYTYTNANAYVEDIIVSVGTVTLIEFSRDGTTWYATGIIAGMVRLSPGDKLKITYTLAPTLTRVPR